MFSIRDEEIVVHCIDEYQIRRIKPRSDSASLTPGCSEWRQKKQHAIIRTPKWIRYRIPPKSLKKFKELFPPSIYSFAAFLLPSLEPGRPHPQRGHFTRNATDCNNCCNRLHCVRGCSPFRYIHTQKERIRELQRPGENRFWPEAWKWNYQVLPNQNCFIGVSEIMIRVAINGYGRIGRNILRALYETGLREHIQVVAINDFADFSCSAHLTRHDSIHGRFLIDVSLQNNILSISDDVIHLYSIKDPSELPWSDLGVDIVYECTGLFTDGKMAEAHLSAGAKRVLISAPAKNADLIVVYGVNHCQLTDTHRIISNASCTTNCLALLAKVLHEGVGILQGCMTTLHAYTNDQKLHDMHHKDLYRARSATQSIIPTSTGAAEAVGLVLPELAGKIHGMAVRVPTANVSLVDFNFYASRSTTREEINGLIATAAGTSMAGIISYNDEALVSTDFNHNAASSNFDASQTIVAGRWVKVMSWYDNEWAFANRMLDNTLAAHASHSHPAFTMPSCVN